jgi:RimJ/RimL family protein N-acetyltransferase
METGAELHWCIADAASDSMLGNIQIFRMGPVQDRFQGELGYWLRPGARGWAIVVEALRPLIAHAFRPVKAGGLGLVRLYAATDGDNYASQSILRSAGFTQWGANHRAWRRSDGSLSDGVYFELLASQLPNGDAGLTTSEDPVTLEGAEVRLRRWRHTDADRVAQACSDQRTQHWLGHSLPWPYTIKDAHTYVEGRRQDAMQGVSLSWCVAELRSDLCLGSVAVMDLADVLCTSGEIGYWTHPDARGRGVMSEAVRLAVRHAFIPREDGGLGRLRLQIGVAAGNYASEHIALTAGFLEVGRDRQAEPLGDGSFVDLVRFDLLVAEWPAPDFRPSQH